MDLWLKITKKIAPALFLSWQKEETQQRYPWTDIKDQNVWPCATTISPDLRPSPPQRTRGPVCAGGSSQWWQGAEICFQGRVLYWSWKVENKRFFQLEVGHHDLQLEAKKFRSLKMFRFPVEVSLISCFRDSLLTFSSECFTANMFSWEGFLLPSKSGWPNGCARYLG